MTYTHAHSSNENTGGTQRVVVMPSASPRAIEWAAERLAQGGVIALPTDTVYGIAASLSHPAAIARLYDIKGRPSDRPIPILVSSTDMIESYVLRYEEDVGLLLDQFWPGPLTIVLPARKGMPAEVTAGGATVGIRMPNHPLAIEVIARAGGAVACTSANRSGDSPATHASEVAGTLGADLDLILDGGIAPGGVPSTVIEIAEDVIHVHREGGTPSEAVEAAWRELLAARETN
jgi:L-threonylcarbamoyladenylate synthase